MTMQVWLSFALLTFVWTLIPGPSIGFTIAYAMQHGRRSALLTIAGQLAVDVLAIFLVASGLTGLIAASVEFLTVLKWAGVAYLVYLGVREWRTAGRASSETALEVPSSSSSWGDFRRGFVVCAGNPKSLLYFGALFPQFLTAEGSQSVQLAWLGATNVAIGALVMVAYALLADRVRGWLKSERSARIRARASGTLMVAAAAYLAVERVK